MQGPGTDAVLPLGRIRHEEEREARQTARAQILTEHFPRRMRARFPSDGCSLSPAGRLLVSIKRNVLGSSDLWP